MHINGDKFFVSGILGGQVPIALGVAMALKRKGSKNKVGCFMGDMGSSLGLTHECVKYAQGFDLPIRFIVEDNGSDVVKAFAKARKLVDHDKVDVAI